MVDMDMDIDFLYDYVRHFTPTLEIYALFHSIFEFPGNFVTFLTKKHHLDLDCSVQFSLHNITRDIFLLWR